MVHAGEARRPLRPERRDEVQCLVESGDAFTVRWEGVAVGEELGLLTACPDAQDEPSGRQEMQGGAHLGDEG